MGVPASEVGYTSPTASRGDHENSYEHVVALEKKKKLFLTFTRTLSNVLNSCVTAFCIIYELMYPFLMLVSLNMNCTEITCPYVQSRSVFTGICFCVFISMAFSFCVFLQCTVSKIAFTFQMVIRVLQGILIRRLSCLLL